MSKVYTSSDLINSLQRRGMIPTNQVTYDTDDFLDILNEELSMEILPFVLATHEEYFVTSIDVELISGQTRYPIPERATGNKLRGLFIADSDGNLKGDLARINLKDYLDFNGSANYNSGYSSTFYVENNNIVLTSAPGSTTDKLRMYFFLRPNTLVENKYAGTITNIDTVTGVVTLSTFPTEFSSMGLMDFVEAKGPNVIKGYDIQPTAVDANVKTITFDPDDLPSTLVVGDYLNVAQESIVPQLPTELHALLAQKAALTCIEGIGDLEAAAQVKEKFEKMEKKLYNVIDNRVESSNEKIYNKNSPLRYSSRRYNRGTGWRS